MTMMNYCAKHGVNSGAACRQCVAPDAAAVVPLAGMYQHKGIMTLGEIAAAEQVTSLGASDDPRRPGPTCLKHWPTHHTDCSICRDTLNQRVELSLINPPRQHSHYFKDVSKLETVDVYRVLALFAVTDPCLQHAVKKLLVAGGRGAGKDISQDVKEAIDSLKRWQAMRAEEAAT